MVIAIAKQNADKSGVIGVDLNIKDIVQNDKNWEARICIYS